MPHDRLRILHAIHDFLPRHRAGSEIYAFELCKALAARHHPTIVCAEYDPGRRHGHVTWRMHEDLPVVELVNNWKCASFDETYRPPVVGEQISHVLRMVQPDVVHLHSLLNLSFDLPAEARRLGIPVVATLHDYTLVCASGGQRVHRAEQHVCDVIETDRCARCFRESPFHSQISFGAVTAATGGSSVLHRAAAALNRRMPEVGGGVARMARYVDAVQVTRGDIDGRMAAARAVFEDVDLFVAPSRSIASEFCRLGLKDSKVRVSDYGFAPLTAGAGGAARPRANHGPLRIGFVGTLVWHKGVHVLLEAVRQLPQDAFELHIFGDTDVFPDYVAQLRALGSGLPVRFAGAFDRSAVSGIYQQFDVLVVPSLWLENSPLVIHEAFMAGVPVVGARMGGIAELIRHEQNGLLYDPPSSSAALAAALRRLIDDPARLASFAASRVPVKSIEEDAREWEAIYAEMIGRRTMAGQTT
jgi:glycosyltransferase involved in cell wall biosynthesis